MVAEMKLRYCHRVVRGLAVLLATATFSCIGPVFPVDSFNPFTDLPPIPLTGETQELTTNIVPLGLLSKDQVIRLKVSGSAIEAVLILIEDEQSTEAGVIAGGGPANTEFDYRVQIAGRYFAFIQFDASIDESMRGGTIQAASGDPDYQPPDKQIVQVVFEENYLSDPGLFDPVSGTEQERRFLEDIQESTADTIVERMRTIFAGTPIEIIRESDPVPNEPFSRLTFKPDHVLAENQDVYDAALPPPDPTHPECQVRVIFGEMLPRGIKQDPGNQRLDDEAVVYVGSFQGRGESCRTAATDSLNNVVLSLAQTGAHEIGHLVGLYHVEQVEIMHRTATLAFQRELDFTRGQIQIEKRIGDQVVSEVLTSVVQDPTIYFQTNFGSSD